MRLLIVASFITLLAACGGDGQPVAEPTSTPDERIEYWAELLAERQFEARDQAPFSLCDAILNNPEGLALGDGEAIISQIPREIGEAVSIRMSQKLEEKCRTNQSPSPSN